MSTYGTGVGTADDFDPSFAIVDEILNTIVELTRRLSTPRGALPWAPNDGLDLTIFINSDLDDGDLNAIKTEIVHELLKDERVDAVTCTLRFDAAAAALRIEADCVGALGPFQFAIVASAISVQLLDATA